MIVKPLERGSTHKLKIPSQSSLAHLNIKSQDVDLMTRALLHDVEPLKSMIADLISQMI